MGLAQFQSALARLYVDERFRQKLGEMDNAEGGGDLTADEREQLILLAKRGSRLARFSESLIAKRRGEVAKLLPATTLLLGQTFRPFFREYAGATQLSGLRKHDLDAIFFARRIAQNRTLSDRPWIQEIARFEADRLAVSLDQPLVRIRFYRYPVHRLLLQASELHSQTPTAKTTPTFWFRLPVSKEIRCRILTI